MRRFVIVLVQAALLPASAAVAEPTAAETDYGVNVLVVDAVALAIAAAVGLSDARDDFEGPPSAAGAIAGTWWALSTAAIPAVHFQQRSRVGWASFGLRLVGPPLVGLVGAFASCMSNIEPNGGGFADECEDSGFATGMILGTAAMSAMDAFVLARTPPTGRPATPQRWYGWQSLLVDAAGVALGAYYYSRDDRTRDDGTVPTRTIEMARGMYVVSALAAPLVHVAHGRGWRALASFGIRAIGVPLMVLPGVVGWCAATGGSGDGACSETGLEIGLISGVILGAGLDAFIFGWEDAPVEPHTGPPGLAWFPNLQLRPGGATVGLGASF